jgi:hypothetical protein
MDLDVKATEKMALEHLRTKGAEGMTKSGLWNWLIRSRGQYEFLANQAIENLVASGKIRKISVSGKPLRLVKAGDSSAEDNYERYNPKVGERCWYDGKSCVVVKVDRGGRRYVKLTDGSVVNAKLWMLAPRGRDVLHRALDKVMDSEGRDANNRAEQMWTSASKEQRIKWLQECGVYSLGRTSSRKEEGFQWRNLPRSTREHLTWMSKVLPHPYAEEAAAWREKSGFAKDSDRRAGLHRALDKVMDRVNATVAGRSGAFDKVVSVRVRTTETRKKKNELEKAGGVILSVVQQGPVTVIYYTLGK